MDPPRIHNIHYHKLNMSTNLLHPQLHNSNQISQLDFERSTGMIQKVHLFLMMFTWDVPLMLVKPGSQSLQQHVVTRKSSPYDGSYQDSNISTIIKSICQTTCVIKNFQSKSNILVSFLKDQLGWSKRFTCFSWCSPSVPWPVSLMFTQDSHFQIFIKSKC